MKNRSGFTLVELLVLMPMILMLLGVTALLMNRSVRATAGFQRKTAENRQLLTMQQLLMHDVMSAENLYLEEERQQITLSPSGITWEILSANEIVRTSDGDRMSAHIRFSTMRFAKSNSQRIIFSVDDVAVPLVPLQQQLIALDRKGGAQ